MVLTVADIARRLECPFEGDGTAEVSGLAGIREAGPGDITFVANLRYAPDAEQTRAAAVVVGRDWRKPCSARAVLRADDPDQAFARIAEWFAPAPIVPPPGVHPTAVVAPDVQLGREVSVGPHCVLEPGVRVGDRTAVGAGCYLGQDAGVGCDAKLYPHVTVRERVRIGDRVIIHNGTVIGSDGFGYTPDEQGVRRKIPQIGTVVIGNDVEIGANVTIDRARFGQTRIGDGAKIDNLVQIGHNVIIGEHAVIVAQVGIAGSTEVGPHAILAGQVGLAGHIRIGAGAVVGARSGVMQDVPPKAYVLGTPPLPAAHYKRLILLFQRLPELRSLVLDLQRRLRALEEKRK